LRNSPLTAFCTTFELQVSFFQTSVVAVPFPPYLAISPSLQTSSPAGVVLPAMLNTCPHCCTFSTFFARALELRTQANEPSPQSETIPPPFFEISTLAFPICLTTGRSVLLLPKGPFILPFAELFFLNKAPLALIALSFFCLNSLAPEGYSSSTALHESFRVELAGRLTQGLTFLQCKRLFNMAPYESFQ